MGLAAFLSGDNPNALVHYQESLDFRHASGDKAGEAVTLSNVIKAYGRTGDAAQEQDHFARALALIRTVGDKRWEANILNNIGEADITHAQITLASSRFVEALQLAKMTSDPRAESVALFGLARAAAARDDFNEARRAVDEVVPLVESLRTQVASLNLRAWYFATLRDPSDFYVDLLMQQHRHQPDNGYGGEALEILERARARTLLETLSEARADVRSGADPILVDRERSRRERIEGKRDVQIAILSQPHTEAEALTVGPNWTSC